MDRFGTLQLFTAVSLLGHVCHCWQASVPKTVTAIRDSCVLVPCSTIPYSKVDWYKYKSVGYPVVYSNVQSEILDQFKGRTSVPGDAEKGDCSLRINNVQKEDGEIDLYVWVFKPDGSHDGFEYHTTKINILNPTHPIITADSIQVDGKAFTAKCKFNTSCPTPPEMFWKGLDNISNKLIHTQNSDTLWYTEIIGTIIVSRKNQGAQLSCTAKLKEQEYQSTSITLDVLYAPTDVRVDFTGKNTVVEGQSISLACTSDCKPSPTDYEWVVNQNSNTKRYNGRNVVLNNVMRNTYVSCIAINSIGRGESKVLPLTVYYPPSILLGSFCSVSNRLLKCVCKAVAKPDAEISWTIDGSSTLSPALNTTTMLTDSVTVSELTGQWDDGGNITCTATNIAGSKVHQIDIDKRVDSLVLVAGVGAACLCGILGVVTVIMICKKRRRAEPPTDLITVQTAKISQNKRLSFDEDLYVNAEQFEKKSKEQDAESCIYENYDKRP
ncbi:myelin-associated glycoprotein-like [Tachysurus fulvidraco]|uniref:myelin-associated glycoprotein-like n=1 Tax=Tachysurus fulvidraco TaxID=1234273 RepID=UPI001FF004B3|nr:myelin-associated glycoprotein-like [Tachysurus fulvidraco]